MIRSSIIDSKTGEELSTESPYEIKFRELSGRKPPVKRASLIGTTYSELLGVFKSIDITSAGTYTIAEPSIGGAIVLTDLIMSGSRRNGASITLRFSDGTNSMNIFRLDLSDAPLMLAHSFRGRWLGWKDAKLEAIGAGPIDGTVSVGYFKIKEGYRFEYWSSFL